MTLFFQTTLLKNNVGFGQGVEASVDGVLGGYGNVDTRDVVDSKAFLLEMFKECPPGSSNLVALGEYAWPLSFFILQPCQHLT